MSVHFNLGFQSAVLLHALSSLSMAADPGPLHKVDATPPGHAPQFTLTDQNAVTHRFTYPRKKASVLVLSDHQGSSQIAGWIAPLFARYGTKIDIAGIADLPGIPSMFHALFRREFKKKLAYPVMLDWSGDVARAFSYRPKNAHLLVIGRDGKIHFSAVGPAQAAKLAAAIDAIDSLASPP